MTIIHKVKGVQEKKLTEFLQELIQSLNNPTPQPPPVVKSEEQSYDEIQGVGYSYPASLGTFRPPAYQMRYMAPGMPGALQPGMQPGMPGAMMPGGQQYMPYYAPQPHMVY